MDAMEGVLSHEVGPSVQIRSLGLRAVVSERNGNFCQNGESVRLPERPSRGQLLLCRLDCEEK